MRWWMIKRQERPKALRSRLVVAPPRRGKSEKSRQERKQKGKHGGAHKRRAPPGVSTAVLTRHEPCHLTLR